MDFSAHKRPREFEASQNIDLLRILDRLAPPPSDKTSDATICDLGRSISRALESVTAAAESARAKIEEMRRAIHAAVDARFDELAANLSSVEREKTVALERELISVDACLERARLERASVQDVVASPSGVGVTSELISRLDTLDRELHALPTSPIEPDYISFASSDVAAMLSAISKLCAIHAPRRVDARDVFVRGIPKYATCGRTVEVTFEFADNYPLAYGGPPEATEAAVASLASGLQVTAVVTAPATGWASRAAHSAQVTITQEPASECVSATTYVPANSALSKVELTARVRGEDVLGFPTSLTVVNDLAPQRIDDAAVEGYFISPSVSAVGEIYVPNGVSGKVLVLASSVLRRELRTEPWGLQGRPCATCFDDSSNTLFVADTSGIVVAVDGSTGALRWSSQQHRDRCYGLSVAHGQRVLIAVSYSKAIVSLLRLSDGAGVFHHRAASASSRLSSVQFDSATSMIYAADETNSLLRLDLRNSRVLDATFDHRVPYHVSFDVVVLVPPPRRSRATFLLLAKYNADFAVVVSLPSLDIVHEHRFRGMHVVGLTADPRGTAIVVCDGASGAAHVFPWPLPGMPTLESFRLGRDAAPSIFASMKPGQLTRGVIRSGPLLGPPISPLVIAEIFR